MTILGRRITELRESRKMTQEELAKKLNISRASLSHYEKNRREPDYETLQKIADYFQVSIDYMFGRTTNSKEILDEHVRDFVDSLELSDSTLLESFTLTIDGRELTDEEARRFIAFVRAERSINS
jgi:transcriptional regulator with XRE-family HTH domain